MPVFEGHFNISEDDIKKRQQDFYLENSLTFINLQTYEFGFMANIGGEY